MAADELQNRYQVRSLGTRLIRLVPLAVYVYHILYHNLKNTTVVKSNRYFCDFFYNLTRHKLGYLIAHVNW